MITGQPAGLEHEPQAPGPDPLFETGFVPPKAEVAGVNALPRSRVGVGLNLQNAGGRG